MKKTRKYHPYKYVSNKERFEKYIAYQKRYKGLVDFHVTLGASPENEDKLYAELLEVNKAADNGKYKEIIEL